MGYNKMRENENLSIPLEDLLVAEECNSKL